MRVPKRPRGRLAPVLAALKAKEAELRATVAAKDAQIAHLQAKLGALHGAIDEQGSD